MPRKKNKLDWLYLIILGRISSCKSSNKGIISFKNVNIKIGTSLQLPKKEITRLLYILRDERFIEIVPRHGIRIKHGEYHGK